LKVLLAHPGTQHSGRIARQLTRLGYLNEFHTGIAVGDHGFGAWLLERLPTSLQRRISNRRVGGVPAKRLRVHPVGELRAMYRQRIGTPAQHVLHDRNSHFQDRISNASLKVDAVIGFDTSSWKLAQRCRTLGIPFILDQSTPHPDSKTAVGAHLHERYPHWADDDDLRLDAVRIVEETEHQLATKIVVASTFCKATLVGHGVSASRIEVNPYGVDCQQFAVRIRQDPRPARLCFVGSINARKGVPQLLHAWDAVARRDAELWFVGSAPGNALTLLQAHRNVIYKGAVPHRELASLLGSCDALVFPSFFEGFGLVILEAMACGLPVITTEATAGPDLIRQGVNGWIVPAGDDEALKHAIELFLSDPGKVAAMGREARATAERFTWDAYGDRWKRILSDACSSS